MQFSNEEYENYRPLLFALGYRLLGSVSDAEDVVQETFLKAYEVEEAVVENKKAYLCKMMTNRCIDLLKSARKKREQYIGPWNPEPLMIDQLESNSPINTVLEREGISIAYLRMMENLSPEERAIILLRDVFEFPYKMIAETVNKKEDHCRKLYSRAKEKLRKVEGESLHYEKNKDVINAFIHAIQLQNIDQLLHLVSENVTLYSDGGGKVLAATRPIATRSNVLAFLNGILQRASDDYHFELKNVNGQPAIVNYMDGKLHSVVSFLIKGDTIQEMYMTVNPDKLPNC